MGENCVKGMDYFTKRVDGNSEDIGKVCESGIEVGNHDRGRWEGV